MSRPELSALSSHGLDAVEGEGSVEIPLQGSYGQGLFHFPFATELAVEPAALCSQWVLTYHQEPARCELHCG